MPRTGRGRQRGRGLPVGGRADRVWRQRGRPGLLGDAPIRKPSASPTTTPSWCLFSGGTNTGCGAASSQTGPVLLPGRRPRVHRPRLHGPVAVRLRGAWRPGHGLHRRPRVRSPRPEPHRPERRCPAGERGDPAADGDRPRAASRLLRRGLGPRCRCSGGTRPARLSSTTGRALRGARTRPAAVGDDRIQMQTQGRVDPDSFTHGTSEQREGWFRRGYETGDPTSATRSTSCDQPMGVLMTLPS